MGTSLFHKKTAACFVLRFFCARRLYGKTQAEIRKLRLHERNTYMLQSVAFQ